MAGTKKVRTTILHPSLQAARWGQRALQILPSNGPLGTADPTSPLFLTFFYVLRPAEDSGPYTFHFLLFTPYCLLFTFHYYNGWNISLFYHLIKSIKVSLKYFA